MQDILLNYIVDSLLIVDTEATINDINYAKEHLADYLKQVKAVHKGSLIHGLIAALENDLNL